MFPSPSYPCSITLSKRQKECALLLLEGLTTKQIDQEINLSPRTVE
ncbi:MAG: LuxR C-terminal-related transcriptional regulator [Candidatus Paracaedibacteraceae bacterium]|nr:LuxR C-terminal-related transcriptional regulator [Candidatus Paracaedibacteraceae bacterium]